MQHINMPLTEYLLLRRPTRVSNSAANNRLPYRCGKLLYSVERGVVTNSKEQKLIVDHLVKTISTFYDI
jgi:hypothetical protein